MKKIFIIATVLIIGLSSVTFGASSEFNEKFDYTSEAFLIASKDRLYYLKEEIKCCNVILYFVANKLTVNEIEKQISNPKYCKNIMIRNICKWFKKNDYFEVAIIDKLELVNNIVAFREKDIKEVKIIKNDIKKYSERLHEEYLRRGGKDYFKKKGIREDLMYLE